MLRARPAHTRTHTHARTHTRQGASPGNSTAAQRLALLQSARAALPGCQTDSEAAYLADQGLLPCVVGGVGPAPAPLSLTLPSLTPRSLSTAAFNLPARCSSSLEHPLLP